MSVTATTCAQSCPTQLPILLVPSSCQTWCLLSPQQTWCEPNHVQPGSQSLHHWYLQLCSSLLCRACRIMAHACDQDRFDERVQCQHLWCTAICVRPPPQPSYLSCTAVLNLAGTQVPVTHRVSPAPQQQLHPPHDTLLDRQHPARGGCEGQGGWHRGIQAVPCWGYHQLRLLEC